MENCGFCLEHINWKSAMSVEETREAAAFLMEISGFLSQLRNAKSTVFSEQIESPFLWRKSAVREVAKDRTLNLPSWNNSNSTVT